MMNKVSQNGLVLFVCFLVFPVHHLLTQEVFEGTPEATPESVDLLDDLINAVFTVDRSAPLTGEPVELTLIVEVPADARLADWPDFPADWSPLQVRHQGNVTVETRSDGTVVYAQMLTVHLWVPGEHETPETLVGYQLADIDDVYYVPVQPVQLSVPSSLESRDLNQLARKPIRPPITFFYLPTWSIVGMLAFLMTGTWLWLRWLERRRVAVAARANDLLATPTEIAMDTLSRLNSDDLTEEQAFVGVSTALRIYIKHQFSVAAPDMTTPELLETLINLPQDHVDMHLDDLDRILRHTDLVKFANLSPPRRSVIRLIDLAHRWVSSVKPAEPQLEDSPDEVGLA